MRSSSVPITQQNAIRTLDRIGLAEEATHRLHDQGAVDRAHDDRLSGAISDDLWSHKSQELEAELQRVRTEMERHEARKP